MAQPLSRQEAINMAVAGTPEGAEFRRIHREGEFWTAVYRVGEPMQSPDGRMYVPIRNETIGPVYRGDR